MFAITVLLPQVVNDGSNLVNSEKSYPETFFEKSSFIQILNFTKIPNLD